MVKPVTSRESVQPAGAYHAVHLTEDPARALVWRAIADYLAPWVSPDAHVLEIGAGYCCWINAVRAKRKVAVDIWPEMPSHVASGVESLLLDVSNDLPSLGHEVFDVVLASNVIEHFVPETASDIVGNVAALLKPGGRFIVIQPNFRYAFRHYFDDYTHRSIFTDVSLSNLLKLHGFRIEMSQPRFLPYSMRESSWPVRSWLVRAYLRSPFKPRAGQMLILAQKR
jgi:cyclopropane fatty-acyl-phospholipid synthase-like methyltransferase